MSTTLQDIIDRIRFRTNLEVSQLVTDTELTTYINDSLSELHNILVSTYEDYIVSTTLISITNNEDGYNFMDSPSNMLKLKGVDRKFAGQWYQLDEFMFKQRDNNKHSSMPISNYSTMYRWMGDKIWISPASDAVADYQLWFVPKFVPLEDGYSELESYMDVADWVEYAVADGGVKIYMKQDMDPSAWMKVKQECGARVINSAKPRDQGGIKKIIHTRYDYYSSIFTPWPWRRR